MLLLDFTELLLEATLDDERTELLDPIVPSELQDHEVGSSSCGAKLLSSSPHATKSASAKPSKKRFMQIFLLFHHP